MRNARIPDILLERYLLGELPPAQKRQLEEKLARDPVLKERLETLRASSESFARTHDAGVLARGVRERLRRETLETGIRTGSRKDAQRGTQVSGFTGWKPVLGSAFLLALVALPAWRVLNGNYSTLVHSERSETVTEHSREIPPHDSSSQSSAPERIDDSEVAGVANVPTEPTRLGKATSSARTTDDNVEKSTTARVDVFPQPEAPLVTQHDTRLKGLEPALALFRKTSEGSEPLQPGAKAKPGDVLRIGYRAAGKSYGAIFSVDGNGNITRHWPRTGDRAARLEPGEHLLPDAFELDAAPAYERFYLLIGDRVFDLKPLLPLLHAERADLPHHVSVIRFELLKETGI